MKYISVSKKDCPTSHGINTKKEVRSRSFHLELTIVKQKQFKKRDRLCFYHPAKYLKIFPLCIVEKIQNSNFCWMIKTQPIPLLKLFLLYFTSFVCHFTSKGFFQNERMLCSVTRRETKIYQPQVVFRHPWIQNSNKSSATHSDL